MSVFFGLALLVFVFLGKKILGSPCCPSVFFGMVWVFVFVTTGVAAADYYFSFLAAFWITAFIASCFVGEVVAKIYSDKINMSCIRAYSGNAFFKLKYFKGLMVLTAVSGILSVSITLSSKGYGVLSLFSIDTMLEVSRTFSLARYEDQFQMPLIARLLQLPVFFGGVLAGFRLAVSVKVKDENVGWYYYMMPVVPSILIAIALTTRAAVIFNLILFMSGFVSGKVLISNDKIIFSKKFTAMFFLIVLTVTLGFVVLQFMRGGVTDLNRLGEILAHIRKWPFGSLAGYSVWFDSSKSFSEGTGGYYTFVGIFDLLGVRARSTGLYVDYVDLGDGSLGNVYTSFRGTIEDFTVFGGVLFYFVIGFIGGCSYRKCKQGYGFYVFGLAMCYSFILFSPFVSFWAYSAHIMAMFFFGVYVSLFYKKAAN